MRVAIFHIKSVVIYVLTVLICCVSQSSVPVAEQAGGSTNAVLDKALSREQAMEVFTIFQKAYPGRFGKIEMKDDDVTITLDGVRFYWAEGKILPEHDLPRREEYHRQAPYTYKKELEPVPEYTPEMKAEMDAWVKELDDIPVSRHPGLFTLIWRIYDARSADHYGRTIRLFGRGVRQDRKLALYLRTIRSVSGLYWRKIARTQTLSFHAFGAAVDVVSANPRHGETYWLWARARDEEWYTRPLSRRHVPPASFVEVFEKHGFVWGGKWLFYDTIHFEYRPDVLLYNGFTIEE
jgi:hypothetical protein